MNDSIDVLIDVVHKHLTHNEREHQKERNKELERELHKQRVKNTAGTFIGDI